jgi:Protein of unknown function (DUF2652)
MLPKAESACFAIADISGYTHFVSGVELDHAQDIIADIMDTLVRALRPPFRLAKFEGDAAFVYAVADKVDGSLLQDSIEQAYFAFRKRLRNIKHANSCECQACSRMQSLDVKFVVHHGEFIRQKMSGREELAGRDVILVHRLLKNEVGKTFGARAYALYSDVCVQAMGIDPRAQGLIEHAEAIEHIGETKCWVSDLEQAWTRESESARTVVQRADAIGVLETDFAVPRAAVWDLITKPGNRLRAGKRQRGRKHSQGSAGRRHAKPLHARQGRHYRGHPRLAPVRPRNLDHPAAGPWRSQNPDELCVRRTGGWRHAFRGALRQTETQGPAVLRTHMAERPSQVCWGIRDPPRIAGGTDEGSGGSGRAASARFARTVADAAIPCALAAAETD